MAGARMGASGVPGPAPGAYQLWKTSLVPHRWPCHSGRHRRTTSRDMSRFPLLRAALALVLAAVAVLPAQAQTNGRTIRFVVPFGPGGAGDLTARILAQKMSESMGQPIVVDNKPGAGGVVASSAVAKAPPDGQTLLLLTNAVAVTASLFKTLPYDTMKDLAPVTTLGYFDMALVTSPDSRFKSLPELLAYARANP